MSAREIDPGLGSRVRARREALGFSPEVLAIETDGAVSSTTIRDLERGYSPQLSKLRAIAEALHTSVGALLGEVELPATSRLSRLEAVARDLPEGDIEVLALMARQLASARAGSASDGRQRASIPNWDRMTPAEQRAAERAERTAADLSAAEEAAGYQADGGARPGRRSGRRDAGRQAQP